MDTALILQLTTGAFVGGAAGFLGSFMILKRMSLVGDALSHVALPGMAVAILLSINPMLGALAALTLAIIGIWYLGEKTDLYSETLVGIFFTASLAVGILVTPKPELLETLFGDLQKINYFDGFLTVICAVLIFWITRQIAGKLLLGIVSEDLAKSTGINIQRVNFVFLLMVGLVVALGVKFVGTLLTGALVIVPAAAAKNISRNAVNFQVVSTVFGVLSTVMGMIISSTTNLPPGPSIVLTSIFIFGFSFFIRSK